MSGGDGLAPLAKEWGLPLIWLSRGKAAGPTAVFGLGRRLLSHRPDILFPLTAVPNIWCRLLGRTMRVPFIVGNCRGGSLERQHERWLWPLAHHLLCNTRVLKEEMMASWGIPGEKITVIPNGVDSDYFRPPPAKPGGPPVLVCVARLHPDKGHHTLLRSFQVVRNTFPTARLCLVGDGPQRRALQDWVARNFPSGSVEFCGAQMDVRPYLHRADLLVLSSIREAMPNAILEAMACGLPVVATGVGGVPEVVQEGETGRLVPPKNHEALGEAVCQLLANPQRLAALGQAGRRRAREDFSLESMVRRHEAVFGQMIQQRAAF